MSSTPLTPPPPFADSNHYEEQGFDVTVWGDGVLDKRLAAASRWLRPNCPDIDQRIADGNLDPDLVADIVCQMVARTAPVEALPIGLESMQQSAGAYSESVKRTNPHGDFYLTRQERRTLGCGGSDAFSINLMPDPERPRF